jgi:hypothetical protein
LGNNVWPQRWYNHIQEEILSKFHFHLPWTTSNPFHNIVKGYTRVLCVHLLNCTPRRNINMCSHVISSPNLAFIFLAICRVQYIMGHMCVICMVQTNGLAQLHIHNSSKWHKVTFKHRGLLDKHDQMDFVSNVYSFHVSTYLLCNSCILVLTTFFHVKSCALMYDLLIVCLSYRFSYHFTSFGWVHEGNYVLKRIWDGHYKGH